MQNPTGEYTGARTLENSPVNVWRGPHAAPLDLQYFCHGHSLRTWARYGYTPFSCGDIETVLADEYYEVKAGVTRAGERNPPIVRIGDIIAWLGMPTSDDWHAPHPKKATITGKFAFTVRHTARVITPIVTMAGKIDEALTMVTTKNGFTAPQPQASIAAVCGVYGQAWSVYREKKSD
jgi:hypothetical protein